MPRRSLNGLGLPMRVDENRRSSEGSQRARHAAGSRARPAGPPRPHGSRLGQFGPARATVPTLVGQTERTARLRLEQDGLEVASLSEFRSPDYPADVIVAQDPPPSSRAPQGALLVNRGERARPL